MSLLNAMTWFRQHAVVGAEGMRALLFALMAAACFWALGGVAGCASSPGAQGDLSGGQVSPSEESDLRRRARTRLALAAGYLENGQASVALDELKQVLQIDPNFADAYSLGGLIYMNLNDMRLAEANFQRALSLSPGNADVLHNMGWMYCQQRRYPEARAAFERAIAIPTYTERAKTFMAQGVCEARSGDKARAEASLMRSYELDAANPVTGYNLSRLLYERGDYSRAQFYIRRLNNSELANAESLWLGIQVERRMANRQAMDQLASQLRRRFPQSRELLLYERGAFDD